MNRLQNRWDVGSHVCVGLDPLVSKIPDHLREPGRSLEDALFLQLKGVIDATKDVACAFKPNFGFFASIPNFAGFGLLRKTIKYVHENASLVPVILDGKFNDIGNSSERYAFAALDSNMFGADAVTANPYLGGGAISPFMETKSSDKGEIVVPRDVGGLHSLPNVQSGCGGNTR